MTTERVMVPVGQGEMPVVVLGSERRDVPALVVIPSIFGPAPDLVEQLESLASDATVMVTDPFWRVGPGPVPYDDFAAAVAKVEALDRPRCIEDIAQITTWARSRSNGNVAGLGICFGGPFCLMGAANGWFQGIVTWHGSRMQNYLERAAEMRVPMKHHFGGDDKFVPREVVEQVRAAFADRDDVEIVVHEGCDHGFSHAGHAWNEAAATAGLDGLRTILRGLSKA